MPPVEAAVITAPPADLDAAKIDRLRRRMLNPLVFRAGMLFKLPLGLFAGLRVRSLDADRCQTSVPSGGRRTNPSRSSDFAAPSMAAELSTGAIAMLAVDSAPAPVALLITGMQSRYSKKATSLTTFTCEEGAKLVAAVRETVATGEPAVARVETVGRMADGTEVSRFVFTWSFKKRASRG